MVKQKNQGERLIGVDARFMMSRLRRNSILVWFLMALGLMTGCKKRITMPAIDPGDLTILCVGDSITAGTHGDGDGGKLSYPSLLADGLKQYRTGVQVINEGQNGWAVSDVSQHISQWLEPTAPDIILLQIGTNDLEQGLSPEEAASRLDDLITQIESLAPQSHLYVASTTSMREDNKPGLPIATLAQFNGYIPYIVHQHEKKHHFLVFIDLFKRSGMTDSDFGPDGEHPNDAGYQKMGGFWLRTLVRHETTALKYSTPIGESKTQ